DDDLIKLTAESSVWDMNRILTMLESFIHSQELNEADRKSKINELMNNENKQYLLLIKQTCLYLKSVLYTVLIVNYTLFWRDYISNFMTCLPNFLIQAPLIRLESKHKIN